MKFTVGAGVLLLIGGSAARAQEPEAAAPAAQETPAPSPGSDDVSTIDAIVKAYYEVVSGPAGAPRQWERDRNLYVPGARLVAIRPVPGESEPRATAMDHQQYVEASEAAMVRDGFYEKEVNRVLRRFGNVVQVFSTYEARQTPDGPVKERGVNSLDLFFDGKRWWIASAVWDTERPGNPIPDSLQPWGLDCPQAARGGKKPGKPRPRRR